MKAASANLLAVVFLCALAGVFYVWSALESRLLQRHQRSLSSPGVAPLHRALPADPAAKTFRVLLAVPANTNNASRDVNGYNNNIKMRPPVEDGVFWSGWLEDVLQPAGFTEEYARRWRDRARGCRVVRLEPGCGRISNQLATFEDGTKACVRYGINADQVQGETLTYYLATLLGITNLPPLVLSQLRGDSEQWERVRRQIDALQWTDQAVVSLTQWISNLTGVVTPSPLRQENTGLNPDLQQLHNQTTAQLLELMQWSDLIIFDYLTANFDRLVSNLFSLQWDPRIMERDTNNLLRRPGGDLVFIDNEAGLVHGFRVLGMWEKYHSTVLGSVCVFRRRTVQRIEELHRRRDARRRLLELYRDSEPLSPQLGFLSDEHAGVLQDRIDKLYKHILHCKEKYSR